MLRHHDAEALLVPARVAPVTGYRSYAATQRPRINRLVALEGLGFDLDKVGRFLDGAWRRTSCAARCGCVGPSSRPASRRTGRG